ncbi:MAG: DnaA/Hda family protein [Rhodospirillales bacterium]|nr:DNA replication protein [Rhodospirillaceae bacterium]MDP6428028.1 DnaA/Hda family protein [Rhodospirillales bacterium]MDP6643786.1 DnaA/Hda family protein [Rhodospirillales bacterium]MDP6842352.1 DnaA/Hda family protein [Rhodospirillales bacterium]
MNGRGQLSFTFDHRPALSGDDFLVSACNREAIAWLDGWPDWPAPALIIYGPAGCGKTHLTQVFSARVDALSLSGAESEEALLSRIGAGAAAYTADDADSGFAEETLLHVYNAVSAAGGQLLLTASRPPKIWNPALPDLASRLLGAPACAIGLPDDELIKGVLFKLFSDRQLKIDAAVIDYLVQRIERSLDTARGLVDRIDRAALSRRRDITVPFVRDVLSET